MITKPSRHMNKVRVNKKCRKCGKVPEEGFFISRATRRDWICPKCMAEVQKDKRESLRVDYMEGQGHD